MITYLQFPKVVTAFDKLSQNGSLAYQSLIQSRVERLLAKEMDVYENEKNNISYPLIEWQGGGENEKLLTVWLLCAENSQSALFFYEMIERWLVPHTQLQVIHFLNTQVKLEDDEKIFYLTEIIVSFRNDEEKEIAFRNMPVIIDEIVTGVCSVPHVRKILQMRGSVQEEKLNYLQNTISELHLRFPAFFAEDIFAIMQRFFISFSDTLKTSSEVEGLAKIIYSTYLLEKSIERHKEEAPFAYHVKIKPLKIKKITPFGAKRAIGLIIALHLVEGSEVFELEHIEQVISQYIPTFTPFEAYPLTLSNNGIHFRYIEWIQEDAEVFSQLKKNKKNLEEDFKLAIEKRVKQVFLPRNEEEILKNGMLLSHELKYTSDIPQVIINFENQVDDQLIFHVIIARLLKKDTPALEGLLKATDIEELQVSIDRQKQIGLLKQKYPKELTILSVGAKSAFYLREDHSIDILQARQNIVKLLEKSLGDIRDFNGGLIARNERALEEFMSLLTLDTQRDIWLAKSFFHSLYPIECRSVVPLIILKEFFDNFLKIIEKGHKIAIFESSEVVAIFQEFDQPEVIDAIFDDLMAYVRGHKIIYIVKLEFNDKFYLGASCLKEHKQYLQGAAELLKTN